MDPKGEKYSAQNDHHIVWAEQLLNSRQYNETWNNIVDLGCGTGEVTKIIAEKLSNAQILAVDKFPSMIDQARTANPHPRIEYGILDITKPLNNKYMAAADFLISVHVLHWVGVDLGAALKNIGAILRPNGRFFLAHVLDFPIADEVSQLLRSKCPDVSEELCQNICFKQDWQTSPEQDYKRLCQAAGLTATTEIRRMNHYFDESCLNKDFICVLFPAVEALNGTQQNEVLGILIDMFRSKCQNGKFHWGIDDLIIEGEKCST